MRRIQILALTALVTLLASAPALAGSAPKLEYVAAPSERIAKGERSLLKARCSNGSHVLSGGFSYSGPMATVTETAPFNSGDRRDSRFDGWRVSLGNDSPRAAEARAHVICSKQKPAYRVLGPAGHGPTSLGSPAFRCENGHALGVGAWIAGPNPSARLHAWAPFASSQLKPESHSTRYLQILFSSQVRTATTLFSICGSYPGTKQEARRWRIRPGSSKAVTVECPNGRALVGGGGIPPSQTPDLLTTASHPVDGDDPGSEPDGWRVAAQNVGSERVTMRSSAVCLAR